MLGRIGYGGIWGVIFADPDRGIFCWWCDCLVNYVVRRWSWMMLVNVRALRVQESQGLFRLLGPFYLVFLTPSTTFLSMYPYPSSIPFSSRAGSLLPPVLLLSPFISSPSLRSPASPISRQSLLANSPMREPPLVHVSSWTENG
jgi:hypothetical protein